MKDILRLSLRQVFPRSWATALHGSWPGMYSRMYHVRDEPRRAYFATTTLAFKRLGSDAHYHKLVRKSTAGRLSAKLEEIAKALIEYSKPNLSGRIERLRGFNFVMSDKATFACWDTQDRIVGYCRFSMDARFPHTTEKAPVDQLLPELRVHLVECVFTEGSSEVDGAIADLAVKVAAEATLCLGEKFRWAFDEGQLEEPDCWIRLLIMTGETERRLLATIHQTVLRQLASRTWESGVAPVASVESRVETPQEASARSAKKLKKATMRTSMGIGEEFILLEAPLVDVALGVDGRWHSQGAYDNAAEFEKKTGETPHDFVVSCGLDAMQLARVGDDFERVERALEEVTLIHDDDELLGEAVRLLQADRAEVQPNVVLRLVVDQASNVQYGEIVPRDEPMHLFLTRATEPTIKTMGCAPARLLVASKLTEEHPEVLEWCSAHGVRVKAPTSGFAAGVAHLKRWRQGLFYMTEWSSPRRDEVGATLEDMRLWTKSQCGVLRSVSENVHIYVAGGMPLHIEVRADEFNAWASRCRGGDEECSPKVGPRGSNEQQAPSGSS